MYTFRQVGGYCHGTFKEVTEEQIEKVLNSTTPIEEQVEKLIKKSNARGGTDNISIAYLKKESGENNEN